MLTFGDLRAAVHDVRGNPELVTDVVWALMHAPRDEYRRWFAYAYDNLREEVSGYAHSLGDLVTFIMDGAPYLQVGVDARQRVIEDPRDRVNAHDMAVFLGGVAWCMVHGEGFPQLARPRLYVDFDRDGSISISSALASGSFGVGMLVRDGGWPGVSAHLADPFGGVSIEVAREQGGRLDHDPGAAPGSEALEVALTVDPDTTVDPNWTVADARALGISNRVRSWRNRVHTAATWDELSGATCEQLAVCGLPSVRSHQSIGGPVHLYRERAVTKGSLTCQNLSIFDSTVLVRGDLVVEGALELGPKARLVVLGDLYARVLDVGAQVRVLARGGVRTRALLAEELSGIRTSHLSCTVAYPPNDEEEGLPDDWEVTLSLETFDFTSDDLLYVWRTENAYSWDQSPQRQVSRACACFMPGEIFAPHFLRGLGVDADRWPGE